MAQPDDINIENGDARSIASGDSGDNAGVGGSACGSVAVGGSAAGGSGDAAQVKRAGWAARVAVGIVFVWNVQCALSFLLFPENSVAAYELSGVAGETAIRGIAVAFLMWNVTYPLVIINPNRYRALFSIVLVQQLVGLLGESWILLGMQTGHDVLEASILRFILFDAAGLIIMTAAFVALMVAGRRFKKSWKYA